MKPYYITTAIVYASRKPHIGNNYEIVLSDAIARFRRMRGEDVFFLTGTDEHGLKNEENAKEAGVSPKEYVDGVTGQIKEIYSLLNITYDSFIRTTDDYHKAAVAGMFKKLYEQGDIYKSEYEGLYCTPCESFWTKSQLKDGKCPDCGRDVKPAREEAYFFKLSKYQKWLEEYIESRPDFIVPESRKREMLNNFIKPGLQDLCVSRTSVKWGIPVPFDEKHVVYVWLDALSNYITALGYDPYGEGGGLFRKYWPADVHVIGKDIVRFHTIYWPIFLKALDVPIPEMVLGHPWLLTGTDKMSKSKGNVIYADRLVGLFGADAVRHYVLSEMSFANDGSITYEAIIDRYNSDLANTLGNLVSRTAAMAHKYFDGAIPEPGPAEAVDAELKSAAEKAMADYDRLMETYHVAEAVEAVFELAHRSNKYIDETAPWILAKDEATKPRLATVIYNLLESIRILAVALSPFMPLTCEKILERLGAPEAGYDSLKEFGALKSGGIVKMGEPLFVRIDAEKLLSEISAGETDEADESGSGAGLMPISELISIDEFMKADLRVAEIKECEKLPKAKKLLVLKLDDGFTGRQVVSGIAQWYSPDDLKGKKVIIAANLKPAVLCGVKSEGMIIAADVSDKAQVIFVDESLPNGAKLR